MTPLFILLRNLLLTVLIEGALMFVFTKSRQKTFHSVLVNMLTNPLINLCLMLWSAFAGIPEIPYYYLAMAFLEICALATEWMLYCKMGDFGIKKAFFASLGLNAASFSFGLFIA